MELDNNFIQQLALDIAEIRLQLALIKEWLIQTDNSVLHGAANARGLELGRPNWLGGLSRFFDPKVFG